jgi:hypothetical protein
MATFNIEGYNMLASGSYQFDIQALNKICTDQGGTGGHLFVIAALNEIAGIYGQATDAIFNITALNRICIGCGGVGGHSFEIDAINELITIGLRPFFTDALFYLDGSISGDTLVDISGNDRHFTITGKDFATGWTSGFPYKSAATISAPAGDAVLIAADINNFLYDSGGTPNQIPVISLFQDIDYEHKLFTRHAAQVVDGNGVETHEPRVLDIVLYDNVKTGADLIRCQNYYGVPVEDAAAIWITKLGNDSTGNGTKATPYLTPTKAISVGNNKTCYFKSGEYVNYILLNGITTTFKGLGLCSLNQAGNESILVNGGTNVFTLEGFETKSTAAMDIKYSGDVMATITMTRCKLAGTGGYTYMTANRSGSITFNNCIFNNTTSTFYAFCTVTINNSYFNIAASTSSYFRLRAKTLTINNSRFLENTSTGLVGVQDYAGSKIVFKGNEFYGNLMIDTTNSNAYEVDVQYCKIINKTKNIFQSTTPASILTFTFKNNLITEDSSATNPSLLYIITKATGKLIADISNNNFTGSYMNNTITLKALDTESSVNFTNNSFYGLHIILYLTNIFDSKVQNNILISENITQIKSTMDTIGITGTIEIDNNLFISKNSNQPVIGIGTEASAVSYGKLNGSIIKNNRILCPGYFNNDPGMQHGIFIYANSVEAYYNYLNGCNLGYVIKQTGDLSYVAKIHHNISENCKGNFYLAKGSPGTVFVNNIGILNKNISDVIFVELMADTDYAGSYSSECVVKNNLFINNGNIEDLHFIQTTTNDDSGLSCDNNLYFKKGQVNTIHARVSLANKTFAEWQALGYDTHSIVLTTEQYNALFTDSDNDDYSLKAGSIAIGAGTDLGAAYDDGLDASTDWGSDTSVPVVVTKQQAATWDCGAYVS